MIPWFADRHAFRLLLREDLEVLVISETTKLTQELAVKLEQGRDLRQWHSVAN